MSITQMLLLALISTGSLMTAAHGAVGKAQSALAEAVAPVVSSMPLKKSQLRLAREGRLALTEPRSKTLVPVQWETGAPSSEGRVVFMLPQGAGGPGQLRWASTKTLPVRIMQTKRNHAGGQIEIVEDGKLVLRYNYNTVEPGEDLLKQVSQGNRIYVRARSDYIHPLCGLSGEFLTRDWSIDHPHHRGIYWAWPEVDYGQDRGDLHALQKVFARPTGNLKLQSGPVYAQIEAENQWLWEDREPIVRERTILRAYHATSKGRLVDLAFQFTAMKSGVTLARRDTDKYGGLNLRLQTPQAQTIATQLDAPDAKLRRAWSDLSGVFAGADAPSGLTVMQHNQNPDYPGDWVQYPELSWCQPTFPATGTRYALVRGRPLVLRFRLWIHQGAQPGEGWCEKLWDAFHERDAAVPLFSE